MNPFVKLREKLFQKSEVDISRVIEEAARSIPQSPSVTFGHLLHDSTESEPEAKMLELTPELEEALFPKTPVMISASFNTSKIKETPPREKPEVSRCPDTESDQQFPII